jgi:methionine-rich copper-binding protein CopC
MTVTAVVVPRILVRGTATLLLAGAVTVGACVVAFAHTQLISMAPADGSLVTTAPTSVVLTFDQNIQDIGDGVIVLDPTGSHVEVGKPVILNNTVTANLKPITAPGHYTVDYRITSADGHPVSKQLGFDYLARGVPSAAPTSSTSSSGASTAILVTVAAVAMTVVAVLVLLIRRRRSPSSPD